MDPASRLIPVDVHALDGKEGDLPAETSGVAPQAAVASDDAMARNDDGNGVGPHGLTDGPTVVLP